MSGDFEWRIEIHTGYQYGKGRELVWKPVVNGRNRLRAAVCVFVCLMARPTRTHRLFWTLGSDQ